MQEPENYLQTIQAVVKSKDKCQKSKNDSMIFQNKSKTAAFQIAEELNGRFKRSTFVKIVFQSLLRDKRGDGFLFKAIKRSN